MRKLFAFILAIALWVNFAPVASADAVGGLIPCGESPAFLQRAKDARPTNFDPASGKNRFERYAQELCGPEGLPHLVVDGRLNHAGDFIIPSILFLYIAGWIGWSGRAYLISNRKEGKTEEAEIVIDVPRALAIIVGSFAWPLLSIKEFLSGELTAKEEEIPVSPR